LPIRKRKKTFWKAARTKGGKTSPDTLEEGIFPAIPMRQTETEKNVFPEEEKRGGLSTTKKNHATVQQGKHRRTGGPKGAVGQSSANGKKRAHYANKKKKF